MFNEKLGRLELNVSHELSNRESLKKIIIIKSIGNDFFHGNIEPR